MYSIDQVAKGIRHPELAVREARRVMDRLWRAEFRSRIPHDVAIKGNYWTGNIGNRAVGEILKQRLTPEHGKIKLFGRPARHSKAPVGIIGGGGGFHDRFGEDKLLKRLRFVSREKGAIVATGVPGIRSDNSRQLIDEKLPEIDLITVRSQRDLEQLAPPSECNVHVTACPTLLYADPKEKSTARTGVNFLPWFFTDRERYDAYHSDANHLADYFGYGSDLVVEEARTEYISNVQRICEQLDDPIFIPFHKDDEQFARKHLNVEVHPYTFSVAETFRRVSAVDRMVTTRFHCLVLAAVCRKPTLAIAYAPKVTSLADRLGISSYKPHHDIPLQFESISNLKPVRKSAMKNFELLDKHVFTDRPTRSYSVDGDALTEPTELTH